jgi:hypothetical protein
VAYRVIAHLPRVLKLMSGCVPFRLNAVLIAEVRGESISYASLRREQLIQSQIFPPFFCKGMLITLGTTAPQLSPDM